VPSFEQQIVNNRIVIFVDVSRGTGQPALQYHALLDTGAEVTAVSPKVVQNLNLLPIRATTLTVASGALVTTLEYRARVDIPITHNVAGSPEPSQFLYGKDLFVVGLPFQPIDYDVILGMDLIGFFHITIFGNRIIISN
jgi:hypothetical protein